MQDVDWGRESTEAIVEYARSLREARERERTGRFAVEGTRFVLKALEAEQRIDVVLRCRELLIGPGANAVEALLERHGTSVIDIPPDVFGRVSLAARPQGLLAILRQRWTALSAVRPGRRSTWIALQRVRSPGNLGSLLRTADAVGADGLFCLGRDVDPYDPCVVRPTMGSLFQHTLVRTTIEKLRAWADDHDAFLIGASGDGEHDFDVVRYPPRAVLLLGEERKGLSRRARSACDLVTRIPMCGEVDSLNLAVAGSLLLYESFRQGGRRPPERVRRA